MSEGFTELTLMQISKTVELYYRMTGEFPEVIRMSVNDYLFFPALMRDADYAAKDQYYRGIKLEPIETVRPLNSRLDSRESDQD